MIKLSKRLMAVADLINDNCNIIDVGCDHGLLSIYLYINKKNINIIASDINKNALNNAINNIKKNNLEGKITTIISDGLTNIDTDNIDTLIIAGMGTNTIIDILTKDINKLNNINNIIISSNNKQQLLRRSIIKLGYIIDDEVLVNDRNIIYTIIKFVKGNKKYTPKEYKYGPILLEKKDDLFIKSINNDIKKQQEILMKIPKYKVLLYLKIKKRILLMKKIIK